MLYKKKKMENSTHNYLDERERKPQILLLNCRFICEGR